MTTPIIQSIQVGLIEQLGTENAPELMDKPWSSAIYKHGVEGPVWLGYQGLIKDEHEDPHAGGPERAVLGYSAEHYPLWIAENKLKDLPIGAFGENFTIQGLSEETVCIGDTYDVGDARIQVSQPRQPCWKIARRFHIVDLGWQAQAKNRTGWFFRVLKEGYLQRGIPLSLVERPLPQWTVARVNRILHEGAEGEEAVVELAHLPYLAPFLQNQFQKRLAGEPAPNIEKRLFGPNRP